jgi:hypothetical protein
MRVCGRPAQVKYRTAKQFSGAALAAAARTGSSAADRAYQATLLDPNAGPASVHPMMRFVADAAPQVGEAAMRSGRQPEVWPQRQGVAGLRQTASCLPGEQMAQDQVSLWGCAA